MSLSQIVGLLKNDTKRLSLKILEKICSQNIQMEVFDLINAWTISGSTKYEQYLFKTFLSVVVIKKILIMRLIKVASVVSHVLGSIWCCTLLMGYSHWFVMKSRLALLLSSLLHEICWPQRYYRRETSFKDWIYFFSFIYFLSSYFLTFLNYIPCLYQLTGTTEYRIWHKYLCL